MSVSALDIETVPHGIATPFGGNDPKTMTFGGCLYRQDGTKVALSERPFGPGYNFRPDNPEILDPLPPETPVLSGRSLYLGHYRAHYGHFLTETLSTFWVFRTRPRAEFGHIVFHPAAFGKAMPDYARHCFACFDIDPESIVFLDDGPVRFEEVMVPRRLFHLWQSADPALRWVFEHIRQQTVENATASRKLYISRRSTSFKTGRRVVANEVRIEDAFTRRGFEVMLPPETPVLSGRSLYANAKTIAGLTGSALHSSLFMLAGGLMIELQYPGFYDDMAVVTQALCNDVAGIAGIFVSFKGFAMPGSRALHYDTAQIEKALPEDLAPDAATTGRMRRLTHRLRGALEIAMLDVLPVVRGAAGRLRRLLRTGARRSKA